MGVLSNKIERDELKPGDHIYSWRTAYFYAHHGIYKGDGMVIHYTRANGQETGTLLDRFRFSSSPSNAGGSPCEKCGDQSKLCGVIRSCIDCFLAGGNLYLFHYSVSPAFFMAKARGGTCTLAASDETDTVLHRAEYLLDKGFGTYSIFKNNCEDFAIYCKTGLLIKTLFSVGRSGQLGSFTAAFSPIAFSVGQIRQLRYFTAAFGGFAYTPVYVIGGIGLTVVAGSMYCAGRYVSDMGVRRDVAKIDVETLVTLSEMAAGAWSCRLGFVEFELLSGV